MALNWKIISIIGGIVAVLAIMALGLYFSCTICKNKEIAQCSADKAIYAAESSQKAFDIKESIKKLPVPARRKMLAKWIIPEYNIDAR